VNEGYYRNETQLKRASEGRGLCSCSQGSGPGCLLGSLPERELAEDAGELGDDALALQRVVARRALPEDGHRDLDLLRELLERII
jgi:hypothetical protein